MKLLPEVKKLEIKNGYLTKKYRAPYDGDVDERLKKGVEKLPCGEDGVKLVINTKGTDCEKYSLEITEDKIEITSEGLNGIFYGIQTLRQILKSNEVPCLQIEDEPDFGYRGLYHDITRGKIPKASTLKKLIDDMAYFKMNSLQLYVEHVFKFKETEELAEKTGYISKEELEELDKYCYDNFIEFIPSIATFGHMYEILEQEKYKYLRVCKDVKTPRNFWRSRMAHHTIDPVKEESFELVKSLIDQYYPLFKTDKFNICCDETFDLENYGEGIDAGKMYVDFVRKIISHVGSRNKKVMMWADILLKHPETLECLPDDIYYLNWIYSKDPSEEKVIKLAEMGKKQIVCPATRSWSRFCENFEVEQENISKLVEYGYKHGAIGVLNTNWGDYGNPASIDLAMFGIVLGAVKSWDAGAKNDERFYNAVNELLYGGDGAVEYLKRVSSAHSMIAPIWNGFCTKYFEIRYEEKPETSVEFITENIPAVQKECADIVNKLLEQKWEYDEAREEMILCAEGICVLAQLGAKMFGAKADTIVDVKQWMKKYKEKWLQKNKESEISKIEEMILYIDAM